MENTSELNEQLQARPFAEMSDREIAEETLYWLRYTGAALAEIQRQGIGGMMRAMMGGKGK